MALNLQISDNNRIDFVIDTKNKTIKNDMPIEKHRIFVVVSTFKGGYYLKKDFGIDYIGAIKNKIYFLVEIEHQILQYIQLINPILTVSVEKIGDTLKIKIGEEEYNINI